MNKPVVILTGRCMAPAKVVTPERGGKPFVDLTVKLAPRVWNEKTYYQKVYVRAYAKTAFDLVDRLTTDTVVSVSGEGDAVAEQGKDGKTYANIRVVGNVSLFDGETGTTAPPATATRPEPPPPARQPAPAVDSIADEDVPF